MQKMGWLFLCVTVGCAAAPAPKPAAPVEKPVVVERRVSEDDDSMAVSGTLGSLSADEIGGQFERRWSEIKQCYLGAREKQPFLSGTLSLKARIGRAGEIKSVFVVASSIGSYEVERCVLEVARSLTFSKPHGGAEADFTYPIQFKAGQGGALAWDEARVTSVLKRYRRDVDSCANNPKAKTPIVIPPSLGMTIHVAPGGKVPAVGFYADAPLDGDFQACLSARALKWKFEDPVGKVAKATVSLETLLIAETPTQKKRQVVGRR